MKKYTLIILSHQGKVLMLNRAKNPYKGLWNFIGGKLEENETPLESAQRELFEETREGLRLAPESFEYRGIMRWKQSSDSEYLGEMHLYQVKLDKRFDSIVRMIYTPYASHEGVFDWKEISFVEDITNKGVVSDSREMFKLIQRNKTDKYFFEKILDGDILTVELLKE